MQQIISEKLAGWFVPDEAKQNVAVYARQAAIQNAIRELFSIQDSDLQQIVAQLKQLL